jgi:TPR repeat protein
MKSGRRPTCAFCRTTAPESDEEVLAYLRKRVERKDLDALRNMAMTYGYGWNGLPVNQAKCIELLRQSAGLGYYPALYQLGAFHDAGAMGLEEDQEKALQYYKEAAEGGHLLARHNVGCTDKETGDDVAAMRHFRLSASAGLKISMGSLIACFEEGLLQHEDLAETMRAMYHARAEMRSAERDQHIAYLKTTGEYREKYNL